MNSTTLQSAQSKLGDGVAMDYMALLKAERAAFKAEMRERLESRRDAASIPQGDGPRPPNEQGAVTTSTSVPIQSRSAYGRSPLDITINSVLNVDEYKIGHVPDLYYFPSVFSDEAAAAIGNAITQPADPLRNDISSRPSEASLQSYKDYLKLKLTQPDAWLQVKNRQLQCWGRQVEGERAEGASEEEIPTYLSDIGAKIVDNIVSKISAPEEDKLFFDHLLINRYPATGGILHHTDGPRYKPLVAILSLGGPTVMSFREKLTSGEIGLKDNSDLFSVVLESGSLLVFTKDMYKHYMHGIVPRDDAVDIVGASGPCVNLHLLKQKELHDGDDIKRGDRISMTFRNVTASSPV